MPERTSVATDAAGRRVMAKVAGNADEAARLVHEAEHLEAARHPGVVELIGIEGLGIGSILLTGYVDGPALAQVGRLPMEESAGLLAALATTLADLHELGIVHGAVRPDHVIVGPGGRPILCGFAYSGRVGRPVGQAAPAHVDFDDPARLLADTMSPSFDVFALGALARMLAPDPPLGHVLARVAVEATADDVAARPSARAIAEALQQEVPAARLPRGLDPGLAIRPRPPVARDPLAALRAEREGRRPGRPSAKVVLATLGAVAAVGVAILIATPARPTPPPVLADAAAPTEPVSPPEAAPGPSTTRARPVSTTSSTRAVSTTVVGRPAGCPTATAILQADVDGDGCPDALRYAEGILEAGGIRWSLGQAGDQVATGDWACQGSRTLALFRPATGELFRFDGWAPPGRDLTAAAVARVPGGQVVRAADVDRDGCHEVVVERASGGAEVIRLGGGRP